eukprot:EG_transcript_15536
MQQRLLPNAGENLIDGGAAQWARQLLEAWRSQTSLPQGQLPPIETVEQAQKVALAMAQRPASLGVLVGWKAMTGPALGAVEPTVRLSTVLVPLFLADLKATPIEVAAPRPSGLQLGFVFTLEVDVEPWQPPHNALDVVAEVSIGLEGVIDPPPGGDHHRSWARLLADGAQRSGLGRGPTVPAEALRTAGPLDWAWDVTVDAEPQANAGAPSAPADPQDALAALLRHAAAARQPLRSGQLLFAPCGGPWPVPPLGNEVNVRSGPLRAALRT